MATILRASEQNFIESPNKIDSFRIFTDMSRIEKGLNPENLNFDLRKLSPGQYSAPYHFHEFAEELFMIISGSATVRTPEGLEIVNTGDLLFFEKGKAGAHQLYNHTSEVCIFLDVRTYLGYDLCEYPDSNKILIAHSMETYKKDSASGYFDGEENAREKWSQLEYKN